MDWGLPKRQTVGYAQALVQCHLKQGNATMTEASPLVRQWILLQTLCTRHPGVTVKDLTTEMGIGEKTIRSHPFLHKTLPILLGIRFKAVVQFLWLTIVIGGCEGGVLGEDHC